MAGLLDEKSWVGQAYDSLLGSFLSPFEDRESKEEAKLRLAKHGTSDDLKSAIDKSVEGLRTLGVPDAVLDGRSTTTEANLYKSIDNAIFNLPSQVPGLLKDVVDFGSTPIESSKGILNMLEGVATNATDVFYDTLTPKKYEAGFKDWRDSFASEKSLENEANVSAMTDGLLEILSTPQGRREVGQQHSLDLGLLYGALPRNVLSLSKLNQRKAQNWADDNFPLPGGETAGVFGSQIYSGRTSKTWNTEKYGTQADAKARATRIFDQEGVTKASIEKAFRETNHFMTPRGNVVHHINDKDMKFTELATKEIASMPYDIPVDTAVGTYKASELFDHPELFTNYPALADYKINIITGKQVGSKTGETKFHLDGTPYFTTEATHSPYKKEITLYVDPAIGLTTRHSEVIIHEIQHAVQKADDLAGGGNVSRDSMLEIQKGLEAEKAMNQAKWMDKNTSKDEQAILFERMQQIEAGLRSLELVVKDTKGMRPSNKAVMENMRESVYRSLEGEWIARMSENEKQIYNYVEGLGQLDDLNRSVARGQVSPFSYMDNASKPSKFMISEHRKGVDVDPLLKNMYEGGIISAPSLREFQDYMGYPSSFPASVTEQSRRLLSDDQRYAGINKGILQQISKGYGREGQKMMR